MKRMLLMLSMFFALTIVGPVMGVQAADTPPEGIPSVTVSLDGLSANALSEVLAQQKKKAEDAAKAGVVTTASTVMDTMKGLDPAAMSTWTKAFANGVKDLCDALNVSVNDFIKTPAGLGIAGVIIYKVGGEHLIDTVLGVVFGSSFWIISTGLLFLVFKLLVLPVKVKKVKVGADKSKETTWEYADRFENKWSAGDKQGISFILAILWVVATISAFNIIF